MLKEEFEKLTGKQVTWETYRKWNDLYMESDLDKFQFCKSVKKCVKERPKNPCYLVGLDYMICGDLYNVHVYEIIETNIKTGITTVKKCGKYHHNELDRMKKETGIELKYFPRIVHDFTNIECNGCYNVIK